MPEKTYRKISPFTAVLLLVACFAALGVFEDGTLRANHGPIRADSALSTTNVPSCSYGFAQCQDSCRPRENAPPAGALSDSKDLESKCRARCEFLYRDCGSF